MADIASVPGEQAKWRQLHALALSIYQAQQRANQHLASGNLAQAQREASVVLTLRTLFAVKAREIQALVPGMDLSWLDRMVVATGEWVAAVLQALPGALAAIPNAFLDGAALIALRAGENTAKAAVPWALIVVGLVGLLLLIEKTRTSRRFV